MKTWRQLDQYKKLRVSLITANGGEGEALDRVHMHTTVPYDREENNNDFTTIQ